MAQLFIVYWHEIPAQVIVKLGRQSAKRELSPRFQEAIDAYLAAWRRAAPVQCGDDIEVEAANAARRIEAEFDEARLTGLVGAGGQAG
jgi:predicted Zn-dependent protease